MNFYKKYYKYSKERATDFKISYLKSLIKSDQIYKFIAFDDNISLNAIKIKSLKKDELWFSHYIYLNDQTEFQIEYDSSKIANVTGISSKNIDLFVGALKEVYDVCSFSYRQKSYMWRTYANNGNGICIVFNVNDYDLLYPVQYIDKNRIDYTSILIDAFSKTSKELWEKGTPIAELPFVTKNPMNGTMKSYKEKELRILLEPYGDGSFNNGFVKPNIKKNKGYIGRNISYADCGLSVSKIIIGEKCDLKIVDEVISNCNKKRYKVQKAKK